MKAILLLYIGIIFVFLTLFCETLTKNVPRKDKVKHTKKIDRKQRVASKFRRIGQRLDVLEVRQNAEIKNRKEDTELIFEKITEIGHLLNTSLIKTEECEQEIHDRLTHDLRREKAGKMENHIEKCFIDKMEIQDYLANISRENSIINKELEVHPSVFPENITHLTNKLQQMEDLVTKQQEVLKTVLWKLNLESKEVNKSKNVNENDKKQTPKRKYASSCKDLNLQGYHSGIHEIKPPGSEKPFQVYCDQMDNGGGWTVFQRREDGSVEFNNTWQEYENGFGDMKGEFWLGNKYLNLLTGTGTHELRIVLWDWELETKYASYSEFNILSEEEQYELIVSGYSGDAGDSFTYNNGGKFSTYDRDNDDKCAERYQGGWWFRSPCSDSSLNGKYFKGGKTTDLRRIKWFTWRGAWYSYKITEMKFR